MSQPIDSCVVRRASSVFPRPGLAAQAWDHASPIPIERYWSGESAPSGRRAVARSLCTLDSLVVRFDAEQSGPLIANEAPDLCQKTIGLWDRDVCEIFIAPDASQTARYFEFEAAPTGEWLDVAIDMTSGERVADFGIDSGMSVEAEVAEDRVTIVMTIPWDAFGLRPRSGDVWRGNLFRCVGLSPERGYLAWRPTMTERPNFHVPSAFGEILFE